VIELKRLFAETATTEEWHDYHRVMGRYYEDINGEPVEREPFLRTAKSGMTSGNCVERTFLAYDNGVVAGGGSFARYDGWGIVFTDIEVLPEFRRRGIGNRLLDRLRSEAHAVGLAKLFLFTVDNVPSGEPFLIRRGAQKGIVQKGGRLFTKDIDIALMRRWIAAGAKAGFESGVWHNRIPEEHIDRYVVAYNSINDAPHGELETTQTAMTPDAMRAIIRRFIVNGGNDILIAWVRDTLSGEFAAISELALNRSQPTQAFQNNTMTVSRYRGNGFGKLVKAQNALHLIEHWPRIQSIRTSNAEVNDAMLAINEKMGFKQVQTHTFWELAVDRALKS